MHIYKHPLILQHQDNYTPSLCNNVLQQPQVETARDEGGKGSTNIHDCRIHSTLA